MPLEPEVNVIADLNAAWPTGTDPKNQGDDHIRNIKTAVKADDTVNKDRMTAIEGRLDALEFITALLPDRWDWGFVLTNGLPGGGNTSGWDVTKQGTGVYRIAFSEAAATNGENSLIVTPRISIFGTWASFEMVDPGTFDIYTGIDGGATPADLEWMFIRFATKPTP